MFPAFSISLAIKGVILLILRLVLLNLLLLFSSAAACNLSVRDQMLLLELSHTVPVPAEPNLVLLDGRTVECADVGFLSVVRTASSAGYFYVLDPYKAFSRWEVTGRHYPTDVIDLADYITSYASRDPWKVYSNYGRRLLSDHEKQVLQGISLSGLEWRNVTLFDTNQYNILKLSNTGLEMGQFLRHVFRLQIQLYLAENGYESATVLDQVFDNFSLYSSSVSCHLKLMRRRQQVGLDLVIPLNAEQFPYAGRVTGPMIAFRFPKINR